MEQVNNDRSPYLLSWIKLETTKLYIFKIAIYYYSLPRYENKLLLLYIIYL